MLEVLHLSWLAIAIAATATRVCTADGLDGPIDSLVLQADGRIVIGGGFKHVGGVARDNLARLWPDGALDAGFVPRGGAASHFTSVAVQGDGKVIVSGRLEADGFEPHLLRLLPDGSVDAGFADISGNGTAADIVVQPDGKIVIGGDFEFIGGMPHNHAGRINADGSVDDSFDPNFSRGNTGAVWTVQLDAGGKLLFGGEFPNANSVGVFGLTRLDASGSMDPTFAWNTANANNVVYAISPQPDGKILVGGGFVLLDVAGTVSLARLNSDGTTDSDFTNNSATANLPSIQSMALLADGKILISGFHGQGSVDNVQRVNADGTLDVSFHPAVDSLAQRIVVTPSGKILIGGYFTQVNGAPHAYLARLNADGTTDPDFAVHTDEAIFNNGFE